MSIRASRMRNDKVFTKDKQKLGTLVNIFFDTDPDFPAANLVVFPDEPGWVEKELGPLLSKQAINIIEDLMPKDAAKIAKDISDKGIAVANNIWMVNLEKMESGTH